MQDLIDKNVTTKVDKPTKWVSPAFFFPKPDGVWMRLVRDYTKLIKFLHRPIHPFLSMRDILQSIPYGQKMFAKLDAMHGYFQLALIRNRHIPIPPHSSSRKAASGTYKLQWV